jgi:hypothetical protein
MQDVESAYFGNPYHNSTHAADVVQGLCSLFARNAFTAQLTDLEMLAMVLACAIHDVGHPGQWGPINHTSHALGALHGSRLRLLLAAPDNNWLWEAHCDMLRTPEERWQLA